MRGREQESERGVTGKMGRDALGDADACMRARFRVRPPLHAGGARMQDPPPPPPRSLSEGRAGLYIHITYAHARACIYIHTYMYTYICMYAFTYVRTYVHIHIYRRRLVDGQEGAAGQR